MKFMALARIKPTLLRFNNVETDFKMSNITVIFHLPGTLICHLCCWKALEYDIESPKRIYLPSIIQSSRRAKGFDVDKDCRKSKRISSDVIGGRRNSI